MRSVKTVANNQAALDVTRIRQDFPILSRHNRGKPLVYLDSAASTQKPLVVVNAMTDFYINDYANIHRGIYELSERASHLYEEVREKVRQFINAQQKEEIVFVRGTTEAINLVAHAHGAAHFKAGDEVILTAMEHHSNIVPWHLLKERMGIILKVVPVLDDGTLDLAAYQGLFSERTKLVALAHVSNAIGTINSVKQMIAMAHQHDALVLLDGAQAVAHMPVDVRELDADFYAFSAHKLYGPTGIGVLYAKKPLLDSMAVYQGGGGMIETVSFDNITYAPAPGRFEAGTPDIAGVIGLGAALDYLMRLGMPQVMIHSQSLLKIAEQQLQSIDGLRIIGTATDKIAAISFVLQRLHAHDLGTVLDHEGIAIRAGHHCAMPLMQRFGVPATVRASFGVYNDENDVTALIEAIRFAKRLLD